MGKAKGLMNVHICDEVDRHFLSLFPSVGNGGS